MVAIKNKMDYNLSDYEKVLKSFSWKIIAGELSGLPDGKGLNIAYEAIDRHALGHLKDTLALRFVHKDRSFHDFSYSDLQIQTSKFANVLQNLGIKKGERVFSFAGRIHELYITALGTLKYTAVFCPLYSVFGPEPVLQRLKKGDAAVLLTTAVLFEKKVKQSMEQLPALRYVILIDIPAHISEKILSYTNLMEQAADEFIIPETNPEDAALLHFTSGTTGMPKGVLHVHNAGTYPLYHGQICA